MASEGNLRYLTGATAAASLTSKQYYIVKIAGSGPTVNVCSGTTDVVAGVLQDAPASGAAALVAFEGESKVQYGGTITAGDLVGTDGNGKAVTYAAGTDTTKYILGKALVSGASGDIGKVLLTLGGRFS